MGQRRDRQERVAESGGRASGGNAPASEREFEEALDEFWDVIYNEEAGGIQAHNKVIAAHRRAVEAARAKGFTVRNPLREAGRWRVDIARGQ